MSESYFILGLLGAFFGYIVGDAQRELRYRRDARRNLALAVSHIGPAGRSVTEPVAYVRSGYDNVPLTVPVPDDDGDDDVYRPVSGQARRRAVSRPNHRPGFDSALPVSGGRRTTPQAVGVGYDCG